MNVIDRAEMVIDSSIRGFDPGDPNSYDRWDLELKTAEDTLRGATDKDLRVLASVRTERIRIASEAARFDVVLEATASFLHDFPPSAPTFFIVVAHRLTALHAFGRHEEEVQEALHFVRLPELCGSEYLYLLADLSRRHPGGVPADQDLWFKLAESIDGLRAMGYDTLPAATTGPVDLEELAVSAANELGRVNWERGEALIRELSPPRP